MDQMSHSTFHGPPKRRPRTAALDFVFLDSNSQIDRISRVSPSSAATIAFIYTEMLGFPGTDRTSSKTLLSKDASPIISLSFS